MLTCHPSVRKRKYHTTLFDAIALGLYCYERISRKNAALLKRAYNIKLLNRLKRERQNLEKWLIEQAIELEQSLGELCEKKEEDITRQDYPAL